MFNLLKILFFMQNYCTLFMSEPAPAAPPAEPPAEPPAAPPAEPPAQPPAAFHETFQDVSLKEWVQTKGWQNPEAVAQSAFNLEKMVGAPAEELVRVPKDGGPEATRQVLAKLGMPESADKYEIAAPEGMPTDEGFQKWAQETFHKAGLTTDQAKAVNDAWNEYAQQHYQATEEQLVADATHGDQQLQQEWGSGYERQMNVASKAARELGFDEDMINAMQQAKGYAETMKFMSALGEKLGEDSFVSGEVSRTGFHSSMTPSEAKTAYNRLIQDEGFSKALMDKQHPGHKDAVERKQKLYALMYPEEK